MTAPADRKRLWPVALLAAACLLALFETARAVVDPHRVATADDWQAAAAEVRAGFKDGDLIVFAPFWTDPIGRGVLGDLMPTWMIGRPDDARYARVWEVSIRGAHAPDTDGAKLLSQTAHGRVRVSLYERAQPIPTLYDLTSHLAEARVTQLSPTGGETPCYRDAGGFRCATTRVEPRTLEVDYRPRRGVLAPVDGNLTTRIELDQVPPGTLVGWTAMHDYYSRLHGAAPVDFTVFVDGKPALAVVHKNDDGWRRFEVAAPGPSPHTIRFEVKSPNAAFRTFGFHAEVRP